MNRRGFLRGAGALLIAAPAIVRASSLMAISPWRGNSMIVGQWIGYDGSFSVPQIYTASPVLVSAFEEMVQINDMMNDIAARAPILGGNV